MKYGPKPVHHCYTCRLNLGNHCWKYACPHRQWSRKKCPGFENEVFYRQFREWQEASNVKSRKQLRQEAFRTSKAETYINFRKVKR